MRTICTKLAAALLTICVVAHAQAADLYVTGPVTKAAFGTSSITLLGRTLAVETSTKVSVAGRSVSAARFFREIQIDSQIYAEFKEIHGRAVATKLLITGTPYVPGATLVAFVGKISAVNGATGRAWIDGLPVDTSSLPLDVVSRLSEGDLVEVIGIQPSSSQQVVLPRSVALLNDVQEASKSEADSSLAPNGDSANKPVIQGISGSGVAVDGISGSGNSKQGISGSGLGIQGISGSGIASQGISGSGVSTNGISGSGISLQGISGSGISLQGISGSGTPSQSK